VNPPQPTESDTTPLLAIGVLIRIPVSPVNLRLVFPDSNYVAGQMAGRLIAAELRAAGCLVGQCAASGPLEDCFVLLRAAPLHLALSTITAALQAVLLGNYHRIAWRDSAELIWRTPTGDVAPDFEALCLEDRLAAENAKFKAWLAQNGVNP
jgi:hypothetical protein